MRPVAMFCRLSTRDSALSEETTGRGVSRALNASVRLWGYINASKCRSVSPQGRRDAPEGLLVDVELLQRSALLMGVGWWMS